VLVRAGLLPSAGADCPITLAPNDSGRFEDRWVRLLPRPGVTPFITFTDSIELPVAHGEGRVAPADPTQVQKLEANSQIVLQYADPQDQPTQEYPANPNGSAAAIAGACDPTGRIFGLMPHPERHIDPWHHPRWTRRAQNGEGDGLRIFRGAVESLQ
jgi:phosphoribosylformylglycinamidine synthase